MKNRWSPVALWLACILVAFFVGRQPAVLAWVTAATGLDGLGVARVLAVVYMASIVWLAILLATAPLAPKEVVDRQIFGAFALYFVPSFWGWGIASELLEPGTRPYLGQ